MLETPALLIDQFVGKSICTVCVLLILTLNDLSIQTVL